MAVHARCGGEGQRCRCGVPLVRIFNREFASFDNDLAAMRHINESRLACSAFGRQMDSYSAAWGKSRSLARGDCAPPHRLSSLRI